MPPANVKRKSGHRQQFTPLVIGYKLVSFVYLLSDDFIAGLRFPFGKDFPSFDVHPICCSDFTFITHLMHRHVFDVIASIR